MAFTARFDRPVPATLIVRTEHGEEWEATADDVARFRLLPADTFTGARVAVEAALDVDLSDHEHDAPIGKEGLWEAVNLAVHLIESLAIYDFATLEHPEYREDLEALADLLGVEVPAPATT